MHPMDISPKQACEDLVALVKKVKTSLGLLAERHGLTHMQLFVLDVISHGSTTMGRLADNLHCDASNITGIIDRLVVMGLVDRHEKEDDRRIKELRLTAAGEHLFHRIKHELPEVLGCTKLDHDEQLALHRLAERLL